MQNVFSKFSKNDYAKYPYLKGATRYMRIPDLRIDDLTDPTLDKILKRADEILQEAILDVIVSRGSSCDEDTEFMSFPIAIMLAIATENSFIQKRYALAEAKQAYANLKAECEHLKKESREKLLAFAQNFGWNLCPVKKSPEKPHEFSLNFVDYLRNTKYLRERKWKLVNRVLAKGSVYLGVDETTRLLQEEIRRHIEKRLKTEELPRFPPKIMEIAGRLNKLSADIRGKTETEDLPKDVVQTAFPPCMKALYQAISTGHHLSHVGRFTLTSFLINIGMSSESVIELFKSFSDYNEKMTRYQVEHIAGERGSRTRYTPPKCDTLKTHGVCMNSDETCRTVFRPLGYYQRRIRIP